MISSRIDSLKSKKDKLEEVIHNERKRPSPDESLLESLKRQKLQIKEEIFKLQSDLEVA